MTVEYRVLGPLEVLVDGSPVAVPAGRCRVLLATLLLRPNQFVSVDELRDRLWGEQPPTKRALHMVVNRLRQSLGEANCVVTHAGGYEAVVDPGRLDLLVFRQHVAAGDFAAATALWRGPAGLDEAERASLEEERLVALECRIEADLAAGVTSRLLPELRDLTAAHPLREAFWAQLVETLQRGGRRAEAEAAYREIEQRLADELGVDPGPRLRRLLANPPRQLPAMPPHFVGREDELGALTKVLDERVVVISALDGVGGVGKTALAVRWAHLVADRFPDGHLFANLRGFDPAGEPADPYSVMRTFLLALGIAASALPQDPGALTERYRAEVDCRRLLVVLDNARDADQVRPLLPGSGSCMALVTSRNHIDTGSRLTIDVLGRAESMALFTERVGHARVAVEPDAAARLVELCAGLPLALGIVAARAMLDDASLAHLLQELEKARLDTLDDDDPATSVRTVFSWSLARLDAEVLRTFLLIGLHPGPDLTEEAVASLAGTPADGHVRTLVEHSLLTERVPGRYVQHDLLREYAAEQIAGTEVAAEARRRMLDHYVRSGMEVHRLSQPLSPAMSSLPWAPGVVVHKFADAPAATAWLTTEWEAFNALVQVALKSGLDGHAWRLVSALHPEIDARAAWREGERLYRLGLPAARRTGEQFGQTRMHRGFAFVLVYLRDFAAARDELRSAIEIDQERGDHSSVFNNLRGISWTYSMEKDFGQAMVPLREVLEQAKAIGDSAEQFSALGALAVHHLKLGEPDQAVLAGEEALAGFVDLLGHQPDSLVATVHDTLSAAYHALGRFDEARRHYLAGIEMMAVFNRGFDVAQLRSRLALLERDLGNHHQARQLLAEALRFYEINDEKLAAATKALLDEL